MNINPLQQEGRNPMKIQSCCASQDHNQILIQSQPKFDIFYWFQKFTSEGAKAPSLSRTRIYYPDTVASESNIMFGS